MSGEAGYSVFIAGVAWFASVCAFARQLFFCRLSHVDWLVFVYNTFVSMQFHVTIDPQVNDDTT